MRLIKRKSEPERVLETASSSVNRSTLVKAGLIAGGLAVLTAGSAAISSLRRRLERNAS
jgi:hypothetical protein